MDSYSFYLLTFLILFIDTTGTYDFDQQNWLLDTDMNKGLNPDHRSGSLTWQDGLGTFWMFGGEVFDDVSNSKKFLNDLWKLDIAERKWTKVHSASTENSFPPARHMGAACGVPGKYMVIFGGLGDGRSFLGDTWIYDFTKGDWLSFREAHAPLSNESVVMPPSRVDAASWCTEEYMLIFSGLGENLHLLNDMWYFSLRGFNWEATTQFDEMAGKDKFISLMSGFPKPRTGAVTWNSKHGSVYLFGGNTEGKYFRAHDGSGYMSDLWQYDLKSRQWHFKTGHSQPRHTGDYSISWISLASNKPGCRHRAAAWTDNRDGLWMFSGEGLVSSSPRKSGTYPTQLLADFWHFRVSLNQWIWVGGRTEDGTVVSTDDKLPSGRTLSINYHNSGIFYIYGGVGRDDRKMHGIRNDVWFVNANGIVYWPNRYSIGSVLGLTFLGLGLIFFVIITTLFSRKMFYRFRKPFQDVKYSRLRQAVDP